jgi:hypothetical protein
MFYLFFWNDVDLKLIKGKVNVLDAGTFIIDI